MAETESKTIDGEVVVVGGGFAGMAAAARLARKGADVVLIDKNNYHQFQPLLYQVVTAQIGISEVARSLRQIFRRRSVRVVVSEVASIDPAAKTATLADGTVCRGQALVVAIGAEPNFFGIDGAEENSYPMYSLDDAVRLGARLRKDLDAADVHRGAGRRLDLIVVGGGATGVELAGAVAETVEAVLPTIYSQELSRSITVHLVDMVPTILGAFSDSSQRYARRRLEELGVELHLGTAVDSVRPDGVRLADGSTIDGALVVWAGGLKASHLIEGSGMAQGKGGRVDVATDLTVPGFPGVYALGDSANITDAKGRRLPQLGSVAQQSGKWAARNIHADRSGAERKPFRYIDKGVMAMIGRGAAIAEFGPQRRELHGRLAFVAWLGVHAALLSGVWQRFGAVSSWAVDYFSRYRPQALPSGGGSAT